jgi:hypothetical protein
MLKIYYKKYNPSLAHTLTQKLNLQYLFLMTQVGSLVIHAIGYPNEGPDSYK